MHEIDEQYDVAVIGAGPAGCTAAIAYGQQGRRVLLLEANPKAACRLAGEWLHPPGVRVLEKLGVAPVEPAMRHPTGLGFMVFPDHEGTPTDLPYADGEGLSCEHRDLVDFLRAKAAAIPTVRFVDHARVTNITNGRLIVALKDEGEHNIAADLIVGADGRNSITRRYLGLEDGKNILSSMAGIELHDVELPYEGYGHVFLGGPGPVLLYRFSKDRVRVCLDVPREAGELRDAEYIWRAYRPVFPASLVPAFRDALEGRRVTWAATTFRSRSHYGQGRVALVGDAVGCFHPMTAVGMTLGLKDVETLVASETVEAYAHKREQETYVTELVSNALYHAFRGPEHSAESVRRGIHTLWQHSRAERKALMSIVIGENPSSIDFVQKFLHVAAVAAGDPLRAVFARHAASSEWKELPGVLAEYVRWLEWPAASLVPRFVRTRYKARSTPAGPFTVSCEPVVSERPSTRPTSMLPLEVLSTAETTCQRTIEHELDRLFTNDSEPYSWRRTADLVTAAIDLTDAGETTLRRAADHAERLRERVLQSAAAEGWREDSLPSVLLGVLSGTELPLPEILHGVDALLELQQRNGAFGSRDADGRMHADLERTSLACQTLELVQQATPGIRSSTIAEALESARQWVSRTQGEDGAWKRDAAKTALAILALRACNLRSVHPTIRRGVCWIEAHAGLDDLDDRTRALVLSALAVCETPNARLLHRIAAPLVSRSTSGSVGTHDLAVVGQALARYRHWRRDGALSKRRSTQPPRLDFVVPTGLSCAPLRAPMAPASPDDREFCWQSVVEVSRTFSRPIELLPEPLRTAVCCGYLLCRVVDTIEDHPTLPREQRNTLYGLFLDTLQNPTRASLFAETFATADAHEVKPAERTLLTSLPRVMRVFSELPQAMQDACVPWVAEMARGMMLYSERAPGADGLRALETHEDLERYCYYVAGTVGHLLTRLFLAHMGPVPRIAELTLRAEAESFGLGLQLTNILKDVTDDRARGWSFIPRSACAKQGITVKDLVAPAKRKVAHAVVAPIFDSARHRLDRALLYTLAIPASEKEIRLFCLLPLFMAARSLVHARGNDAMFTTDEPVKIGRSEVEHLIAECLLNYGNDAVLRARYQDLWKGGATDSGLATMMAD